MSINNDPYNKAHELARAIKDSDVFHGYIAAKNEVEKNSEDKEKIQSIRKKQMEINRAQVFGEEPTPEHIQELALEFAKLNQKQEIASFFEAEAGFMQMFNDVQEIIQKAIQEDLA